MLSHPFTKSELLTLLEIARLALGESASFNKLGIELDMENAPLEMLRAKLGDYLNADGEHTDLELGDTDCTDADYTLAKGRSMWLTVGGCISLRIEDHGDKASLNAWLVEHELEDPIAEVEFPY